MRVNHTSGHICIGVHLKINTQILSHVCYEKALHYTMALLYTNEENFINRKLNVLLFYFIHDRPTWWNTTALMKTGIMYIVSVSDLCQGIFLLQLVHWINTPVTSSYLYLYWTTKKEHFSSIYCNIGLSVWFIVLFPVYLKTPWNKNHVKAWLITIRPIFTTIVTIGWIFSGYLCVF